MPADPGVALNAIQESWAFRGSPRHAALLADGWEETSLWKLVHGERVSVLMVKVESA